MMLHMRTILLLSCTLLTACGGGSGGQSAAPALPPPPPTNSSLANLQYSETFNTASASQAITLNGANMVGSVTSAQGGMGPSVQLEYDASARSYFLKVNQGSLVANELFSATQGSLSPAGNLTTYDKAGSFLVLTNANAVTGLSYASLGGWAKVTPSTSRIETAYFAFGVQTPASSMPRTGSASYDVTITGMLADDIEPNTMDGSGVINANFASGAVQGTFSMVATGLMTEAEVPFDFTATASIGANSNRFSGSATGTSTSYAAGMTGNWAGAFFGPNAAEVGGSFRLTGSDGFNAVGAFVGRPATPY